MFRGLLCVAVALGLLSAVLAQPAKLLDDPLLQRRMTVWLKMEPMRDALRQIGRQTGVSLRCQDAIADEKVAIFVEERPAHEILTQLAKALRYEWRKHEDGGYLLYVPDETRLQEEKTVNAVREARRRALQELIQAAREVRKMSIEQRALERERLREKHSTLTLQESARWSALYGMIPLRPMRQTPEGEWVETGEDDYDDEYAVYHCLAALPDRAVDALVNGQVIGFSTKPPHGVFLLPDDALLPNHMRDRRWVQESTSAADWVGREQTALHNSEFAGVWLRMATRLSAVEYQLVSLPVWGDADRPSRSLHRYESALSIDITPFLKEHDLQRFWDGWATPEKALQEAFPERVTPREDRPAPPRPQYRIGDGSRPNWATSADILEQLAWATRRPIIGDAFRLVVSYLEPGELLAPRVVLGRLSADCWLRADESGYLLARHKFYLSYRRYELPEAWLRPLEQKYTQQGWLTLDDYIVLAGKLTDAQVEFFTQGRHFWTVPMTQFEFEPLVACLPALRFLASLTPAQRQQLASGQWLPHRRLNSTQQRRFQEASGDRFPPAQQLFREPLPSDARPNYFDLANLRYSPWAYGFRAVSDNAPESPDSAPQEPAVRLTAEQEQLAPYILSSHGYVRRWFSTRSEELDDYIYDMVKRELDEDPGARLMAAHLRGHTIEFITESGRRKRYRFVLSRFEPSTLPERKARKEEP